MIKGIEEHIIFFTSKDKDVAFSPIQNLIYNVVNTVDILISLGYQTELEEITEISEHDMLILVTANIFSNLSHNIIKALDTKNRIELFYDLQSSFDKISKELFFALQAYFTEDKVKN